MKKVTLVFGFTLCLILSVVVVLNAGWWVYTVTEPASSSCSTPSYGDELNEGFLGTGYENTWTEDQGNPDEDYSLPGIPPSGSCDEGMRCNASGSNVSAYWVRSTSIPYTTTVDIVFDLYISSVSLSSSTGSKILAWNPVSGNYNHNAYVRLYNNAGQYQLMGGGATLSSGINVSVGTWYTVTLHSDATADNSYIEINGTKQYFTRGDYDGKYLHLGAFSGIDAGESLDIVVGYIYINTP